MERNKGKYPKKNALETIPMRHNIFTYSDAIFTTISPSFTDT